MDDHRAVEAIMEIQVDAAIAEYHRRLDGGEVIDRPRFLDEHAEVADALRNYLEAVDLVERMAGPIEPLGSSQTRTVETVQSRSSVLGLTETSPKPDRGVQQTPVAPPRETFGRYRLEKTLGRGGMGTVYLAYDTSLERHVALKIPHVTEPSDPDAVIRFHREAQAAAGLHHPRICPVYDVGEVDGTRFLTMQFVEGRTLKECLEQGEFTDPGAAVRLILGLTEGLSEAHRRGVIHRDLKPANIMLTAAGEPIIMDFGLARRLGLTDDEQLTASGELVGSPAYMAPEQVDATWGTIDHRTDIYSLGVILYELLTRRRPFQGSVASVLGQITTATPPRPRDLNPDVAPELESLCVKMMARQPEARYESMSAVASALTGVLENRRNESDRPARRFPHMGTSLAVMIGLLGMLATVIWVRSTDDGVQIVTDDPETSIRKENDRVEIQGRNGSLSVTSGERAVTVSTPALEARFDSPVRDRSVVPEDQAPTLPPLQARDGREWRLTYSRTWRDDPDFDRTNERNPWHTWGVRNGASYLEIDRKRAAFHGYHVDRQDSWADYSLETQFRCTNGVMYIHLAGRQPFIEIWDTGRARMCWNQELDSFFESDDHAWMNLRPGDWNDLRVTVLENRLSLECNGKLVQRMALPQTSRGLSAPFRRHDPDVMVLIGLRTDHEDELASLELKRVQFWTLAGQESARESKLAATARSPVPPPLTIPPSELPELQSVLPDERAGLRSRQSLRPVWLIVVNETDEDIQAAWLNFAGQPEIVGTIRRGGEHTLATFASHPWEFLDQQGRALGTYVASQEHSRVVVRKPARPPAEESLPR